MALFLSPVFGIKSLTHPTLWTFRFSFTLSQVSLLKLPSQLELCDSRKYPYSRRDWNFLRGGEFYETKKFKEMYVISRGVGP